MSTYKLEGYHLKSVEDGKVAAIHSAELKIVAPSGVARLDFNYMSSDARSAEVSLSDYNLILNGNHINDGPLPDGIEVFGLHWDGRMSAETSHVFNINFQDADGISDFAFSVGGTSLPKLLSEADANAFFSSADLQRLEGSELPDGYSINLLDIPGVEIEDLLSKLTRSETEASNNADEFSFLDDVGNRVDEMVDNIQETSGIGHEAEPQIDESDPAISDLPDIFVDSFSTDL